MIQHLSSASISDCLVQSIDLDLMWMMQVTRAHTHSHTLCAPLASLPSDDITGVAMVTGEGGSAAFHPSSPPTTTPSFPVRPRHSPADECHHYVGGSGGGNDKQ